MGDLCVWHFCNGRRCWLTHLLPAGGLRCLCLIQKQKSVVCFWGPHRFVCIWLRAPCALTDWGQFFLSLYIIVNIFGFLWPEKLECLALPKTSIHTSSGMLTSNSPKNLCPIIRHRHHHRFVIVYPPNFCILIVVLLIAFLAPNTTTNMCAVPASLYFGNGTTGNAPTTFIQSECVVVCCF